jgi:BASS family bile acid:Na+ symporter
LNLFVEVLLPIGLALVMFVLGLGLTPADFRRVLERPRAYLTGAVTQLLLVPLVALVLVAVVPLEPALATGFLILAVCPGGPVSNMLTRLVGGDVALSVTLTGTIIVLSIVTLPPLTYLAATYAMGALPQDFSVTRLLLTMFFATVLPIFLGLGLRMAVPAVVLRIEPAAFRVAAVVFFLIVGGAIYSNWDLLMARFWLLAPLTAVMMLVLLVAGYAIARLARLSEAEARAISIEGAVQNATLGVTVGGLVGGGILMGNDFLLPAAVYGVMSYVVMIPLSLLYARLRPLPPSD